MPAILTRLRGLQSPVALDEPLRKGDASSGVGLSIRKISTGGWTLRYEDLENAVAFYDTANNNVILPLASSFTTPPVIGNSILIMQCGAGFITVTTLSGVTLHARSVFSNRLAGRWALATLVYEDLNSWVLSGDLEVP